MRSYIFEGNQFVIGLVELILPFILLLLALILISIFIKKRSTATGICFFLFLSSIMIFLKYYDLGSIYSNIFKILPDFGIGDGINHAIDILAYPVEELHSLFINLLLIMNLNLDAVTFFKSEIYILVIYGFLFFLSFFVFKKKKKEKRTYSDYDL